MDEKEKILSFFTLHNNFIKPNIEDDLDYQLRCDIFKIYLHLIDHKFIDYFKNEVPELKCDFENELLGDFGFKYIIYNNIRNRLVEEIRRHLPTCFTDSEVYTVFQFDEVDYSSIKDEAKPEKGVIPICKTEVYKFTDELVSEIVSVISKTVDILKDNNASQ